jgi:hypothetical protein
MKSSMLPSRPLPPAVTRLTPTPDATGRQQEMERRGHPEAPAPPKPQWPHTKSLRRPYARGVDFHRKSRSLPCVSWPPASLTVPPAPPGKVSPLFQALQASILSQVPPSGTLLALIRAHGQAGPEPQPNLVQQPLAFKPVPKGPFLLSDLVVGDPHPHTGLPACRPSRPALLLLLPPSRGHLPGPPL